MATPIQMTQHTLNALKGWPSPSALDFSAPFDATALSSVAPANIPQGSVVHVSSTGTYLLGVGNANVMPLFTFAASDAYDVALNGGTPSTDYGVSISINLSGNVLALVAAGAYELVSTAFVAGSYPPNTPLTSPAQGTTNAGNLTTGTIGTNMIVGLSSRGVIDNGYGYQALAFWPCPVFL